MCILKAEQTGFTDRLGMRKKKRQGSCANLKVGTLGEDSEVNRNFCYSEKSWLSLEGNHNAVQLVLFKVI